MFDPNDHQSPFMTTPPVPANDSQNQAQQSGQAQPPVVNPLDQGSGDQNSAMSYVDSYQPPQPTEPAMPMMPVAPTPVNEPAFPTAAAVIANPTDMPSPMPTSMPSTDSVVSQALEDQNIFFLLGAQDGTDEEKEAFLDELQQVIWEDFLENDVELLVTEEEKVDLDKIMARKDLDEAAMQEEIVVFLEKLVPDLEEIMLEKALELKEDMVRERIAGMREYYAGKDAQLATLSEAETLINENSWRDAAQKLNSLQDEDQSQSQSGDLDLA